MPATYEPIATTTLGSAASTISFTSIPAIYTDLRLILTGTMAGDYPYLRFNNTSTTTYSYTLLYGNGTAAGSQRSSNASLLYLEGYAGGTGGSIPSNYLVDLFSYAGSTNKTVLCSASENNNGSGTTGRTVGLWRDVSAINRIDIISASNMGIGTTATLYGILKA